MTRAAHSKKPRMERFVIEMRLYGDHWTSASWVESAFGEFDTAEAAKAKIKDLARMKATFPYPITAEYRIKEAAAREAGH